MKKIKQNTQDLGKPSNSKGNDPVYLAASPQIEVAIFDLDRTLFHKNTSFAFYFFLLKEGIVSRVTLFHTVILFFRFCSGFLSLSQLHHRVFRRVLKGLFLKDLEEAADRFLSFSIDSFLRLDIFNLFREAKNRSTVVCLLSSSPAFLVRKIAKLLAFDLSEGTQYRIDKEGRLCEISSLITGLTKKEFAKKWVEEMGSDAAHTTAYSDSCDDLPLLEWAGVAVAVSPDRMLKRIAGLRKWKIL